MTAPAADPAEETPQAGRSSQVLGRRAVALIIDTALVLLLDALFTRPFIPVHVRVQNQAKLHGAVTLGLTHGSSGLLMGIAFLFATIVYFTLFEILFAATPGKLLSSLRVVDLEGNRPRWPAVAIRNVLRPVDAFPTYFFPLYLVGAVSVFLTRQRQRLGDRLGRTLVAAVWTVDWADRSRGTNQKRAGIIIAVLLLTAIVGSVITYLVPPSLSPALKETFYPDDLAVSSASIPTAQRLLGLSVGSASRSGSDALYPLRFTLKTSGSSTPATCTGTVTFHWTGPLDGWTLSRILISCLGRTSATH